MKLLEKILVPIHLNNVCQKQLDTAVQLAQKFNSKIFLFNVLPEEAKLESINSYINQYVKVEMDKIVKKLSYAEDKIEKRIGYGNTFDQIINISESENVNLILIANQPNADGEAIIIDVLSEKLVRKSNKPVWLVKPDNAVIPKNILCPIDFSDSSERALNNAIKIAKTFQAKLTVLNVFQPLQESFSVRLNADYQQENDNLKLENKINLDRFLEQFNFIDVDFTLKVINGKPAKKIVRFAKKNQIDLIFMGATGKSYLQRVLLGSVTELVLRELPASMIINKAENLLDLKIESDISSLEKHLSQAKKLEELGYYEEAIEQLKICLHINDLHLPTLYKLSKLYKKLGNHEISENYKQKSIEVLNRLWDKKIEFDLRKGLKF